MLSDAQALDIEADAAWLEYDRPRRIWLPEGEFLPAASLYAELSRELGMAVGSKAVRLVLEARPALPTGIFVGSMRIWRPGAVEPLAEGLRQLLLEARRAAG